MYRIILAYLSRGQHTLRRLFCNSCLDLQRLLKKTAGHKVLTGIQFSIYFLLRLTLRNLMTLKHTHIVMHFTPIVNHETCLIKLSMSANFCITLVQCCRHQLHQYAAASSRDKITAGQDILTPAMLWSVSFVYENFEMNESIWRVLEKYYFQSVTRDWRRMYLTSSTN